MNKLTKNDNLVQELKSLISSTKEQVTISVNSSLTLMYWHIGFKIDEDILKNFRAKYGSEIVYSVSRELVKEFGSGFSRANIFHMIKFSQVFDDVKIVSSLSRVLSWKHFRKLIYMEDALKREFYTQMCSLDKWSTRVLEERINSMLYERTALSKKPDELISYELDKLSEGVVTPNMVLKDPYVLDFLDLNDRYLEKYEIQEGESRPLGIILCATKNEEQIELLELNKSDIHVAKYLTVLPSKEEFEQKLHKVVANAKLKYQEKI